MKKIPVILVAIIVISLFSVWARKSSAIPTFARKHNLPCNACHIAFPKLNAFGKKFRENGYRMPGDEGSYIYQGSVPLAVAVNVAWESESEEKGTEKDSRHSIDLEEARLFSGGTLAPKVSYYSDLGLYEKKPSEAMELMESLAGEHLQGVIILDDLFSDRIGKEYINVAIGVRELDLQISPMRRLTETQYLVYNTMPMAMGTGGKMYMNGLMFMMPQTGIEIRGNPSHEIHYGLTLLNGRGTLSDNNDHKDIYGNIRYTYKDHTTIEILGYSGKGVLGDVTNFGNTGEVGTGPDVDITRYAISLQSDIIDGLYLSGMYMWMKDSYDSPLLYATGKSSKDRKFSGWFIEADYIVRSWLVSALRWDSVSDDDNGKNQTQITANLSYLLHPNIKFLLEYSRLDTDEGFNMSEKESVDRYLARASYDF